jgi:hypothetical protein
MRVKIRSRSLARWVDCRGTGCSVRSLQLAVYRGFGAKVGVRCGRATRGRKDRAGAVTKLLQERLGFRHYGLDRPIWSDIRFAGGRKIPARKTPDGWLHTRRASQTPRSGWNLQRASAWRLTPRF